MFFNVAHEKSGRPGRLCDVMMMCVNHLGRGLKSPPIRPRTYYEHSLHTDDRNSTECT